MRLFPLEIHHRIPSARIQSLLPGFVAFRLPLFPRGHVVAQAARALVSLLQVTAHQADSSSVAIARRRM